LRRLGADVAVSLDNTLIEAGTFTLPEHGTINVHHGAVPAYRGGPPVFWELADGLQSAGFTIHRVDAGIDTGPVLAEGEVPIHLRRTLRATLAATIPRLHEASLDALEGVLHALAAGTLEERRQEVDGRPRTTPTLGDYLRVRRRLGRTR
jgi:methionyl-tRNA formyltransferase